MIAREPVERREEAVPRRVHLAAAVSPELAADDLVVPVDPLLPGPVAQRGRRRDGIDDGVNTPVESTRPGGVTSRATARGPAAARPRRAQPTSNGWRRWISVPCSSSRSCSVKLSIAMQNPARGRATTEVRRWSPSSVVRRRDADG
jgi:hypothetical protein